jgi:co-chaperonin GroES (HSP10)
MIQPIENKILVKVSEKETETSTGILLLNKSKKEQPRFGVVVAVGEEVKDVSIGMTVTFGNYALTSPIEDMFIMTPGDLFGYFE